MLYFVIVPQLENAYRITVVTRRCITAADIYWVKRITLPFLEGFFSP